MINVAFQILGDEYFFTNILKGGNIGKADFNMVKMQEKVSEKIREVLWKKGVEEKDIRFLIHIGIPDGKREFAISIEEKSKIDFILEDRKIANNLCRILSEYVRILTQLEVSCSVSVELGSYNAMELAN